MERIIDHIRSFRGRQSHYALSDTRKLYLAEDLNVQKMFELYCERYPDDKVSRESYRKIFTEKFNIGFGYPRKDTCSTCDRLEIGISSPESAPDELVQLHAEKEFHLRKAKVFYERKTKARQTAQTTDTHAALAFDFAKNLSTPNISTNDVYYRRQLSLYTFNVHSLSDNEVHLYCYDETDGKKGADDVASMLLSYFTNVTQPISPILNFSVTHVLDRIKTGPYCASFITWWCTRSALSPSKSPFPSEATRIWSVIEILQSLIRRRAWKPLMAGCKSSELQGRIHRRSTSSRWSLKCFRM